MWRNMCKVFFFCIILYQCSVYAGDRDNKFLIVGVENRVHITNLSNGKIVYTFPIINEYLIECLSDCKKIVLLENTEQVEDARINEIVMRLSTGEIPVDLKKENPDYLIYGYLNDVGVKTSGQGILLPTYMVSAGGDSQSVSVRLSVKIMNAHTGKEVFVATGRGQSGATKVQIGYQMHSFRIGSKVAVEGALHNALYKAVRQIADKIIKEA